MTFKAGLVVFMCCSAVAYGQSVTGMDYTSGSTNGGQLIKVYGSGFATNTFTLSSNSSIGNVVVFSNSDGDTVPCDIKKNDCTESQLACYTGKMRHLVPYTVHVVVNGVSILAPNNCAADKSRCIFTPNHWLSPTIDSLEKQNVKAGANSMIKTRGTLFTACYNSTLCPLTKHGRKATIRRVYASNLCSIINSTGHLYNLSLDSTEDGETKGTLWCKHNSSFVGYYNMSILVDSYGKSVTDTSLLRVSWTGKIYSLLGYTVITGSSHNQGSELGGTEVTVNVPNIDDTGTYAKPEVYLAGVKCTVKEVGRDNNITFITPSKVTKPFYRGNSGAFLESWGNPSFADLDEANATTATPDAVELLEETKLCDTTTETKWTRMTGIVVVQQNGSYSPYVFATTEGKLFVDGVQVGYSSGTWHSSARLEMVAGQEYVFVAVAKPGACLKVKLEFYNTTKTNSMTGQAVNERQIVRATSTRVNETMTLSIEGNTAVKTETHPKQQICLTEGSENRRVGFYGVYTREVNILDASKFGEELNELPFLDTTETFVVQVSQGCADITLQTKRGKIPLVKVMPESGITLTELQAGVSDNNHFVFMMNGVPSPLLQIDTSPVKFGQSIKSGLEGLFGVQCPPLFSGSKSFEEGTSTFPSSTNLVPAFCGRYSIMNTNEVFPFQDNSKNPVSLALNSYMCLAVRGLDNSILQLRFQTNTDAYRYINAEVPFITSTNDDWKYGCINLLTTYKNKWTDATGVKLNRVRIQQTESTEPFYFDSVYFGASDLSSSITNLTDIRLGPAYPNTNYPFTMDYISVTSSENEQQHNVSFRPNDCGYEFQLLSFGGSVVTNGSNETSSDFLGTSLDNTAGMRLIVDRQTKASQGLTGTFKLTYGGHESQRANITSNVTELRTAFESIKGIGPLNVFKSHTSACHNMDIYVEFSGPGDRSPLTISKNALTAPSTASLTILQNRHGRLIMDPVPYDMIFTKHSDPQIVVYVNNVPTQCNMTNNNCSFTWSSTATPTVTGMTVSSGNLGDVTVIQGTGFSTTYTDNNVTIGDTPCEVTASTSTTITCTIQNGPLGSHNVSVNVKDYGLASSSTQFTFTADLNSISINEATVAGGINMTLYGTGFAAASEVKVGSRVCTIVKSYLPLNITCQVPEYENLGVTSDQAVQVSVVTNGVTMATTLPFTYKVTNGKILSVVTSSPLTVNGNQTINVTGTNLGTSGDVYLGAVNLTVISRSDSLIELKTITPMPKGDAQKLRVLRGTEGALLDNTNKVPALDISLVVDKLFPNRGSLFGGTNMTILGKGFDTNPDLVEVKFGNIGCSITSLTNTKIVCDIDNTGLPYEVDNMGDTGFGPFFAFSETSINISVADSVHWSWKSPPYLDDTSYGVYEIPSLNSTTSKDGGFTSGEKTREGDYTWTFTRPGTYYAWTGMIDNDRSSKMTIFVSEKQAWKELLSVTVSEQEADYNVNSGVADPDDDSECPVESTDLPGCNLETIADINDTRFNFLFSSCRTSVLQYVNFTDAVTGQSRTGTGGTTLTYVGTGFSTTKCANKPRINNCDCLVQSSNATVVTCSPDPSCSLDLGVYHPLSINVKHLGNALIQMSSLLDRSIVMLPLLQSLSPNKGSLRGGTPVSISALGVSGQASVTFSNVPATCTFDPFVCVSPLAYTGPVEMTVNGYPSACQDVCTFSYATGETPKLTGAAPTEVSTSQTEITLTGSNLGDDGTKLAVYVGKEPCTNINLISTTKLSCTVNNVAAGTNSISLVDSVRGNASSNATVKGVASIDSIDPSIGSIHGGTNVTFTGFGFTDDFTVKVGSAGICNLTTSVLASPTKYHCITLPHVAESVTLTAVSNGESYPPQSYEFSNSASPNITAVQPSSGTAGTSLSLDVENFGSDSSNINIWIGDAECTSVSFETEFSRLSCTAGSETGGSHYIKAHVDNFGYSNSNMNFDYAVSVTLVNPAEGEKKGYQVLTLQGSGFTEDMLVKVCDNVCTFEELVSASEYRCLTPPGTVGDCDLIVTQGTWSTTVTSAYSYKDNLAPAVTEISPIRGGTGGNTPLSITGSGFSEPTAVKIDDIDCTVTSWTDTSIVCNTGPHPGTKLSDLVVEFADGKRAVPATSDVELKYYYVDEWSSLATWGGIALPSEGEFIVIPEGHTILLDTDTPVLSMLLIDGGHLIFDEKDITLRAERILINNGGSFTVGTWEKPQTSNVVIELHGHARSLELPIYGTKVLALRNGTLDMHGKKIANTWTLLAETAEEGDQTITVQDDISDWPVGYDIAIATTGGHNSQYQNEKHKIKSILGNTITLEEPLAYNHHGETDIHHGPDGDVHVEFRAEVLLLSRNVVIRGSINDGFDEEIEACEDGFDTGEFATQTCFQGRFGDEVGSDQFGAHVIIHSPEKDTQEAKARISFTESTFSGQAFRLGRYPFHFHLNGNMSESYIMHCSVHRAFNRGTNLHGVSDVRVLYNNYYNVMGGTVFLEDGIETKNRIEWNVVVFTISSTSLQNDDITPAAFWITNPDNIVKHNHAAGGTHFGFWYRMLENPDGPSYNESIFPRAVMLGEFSNNVAHSNGWFGLWIFEKYVPCTNNDCRGSNTPVPAKFENFTAWNNEKGIESVDGGLLQFIGAILIQNLLANFQGMRVMVVGNDTSALNHSVLAGHANDESLRIANMQTKLGLVIPYGVDFEFHDVVFSNMPVESYAIGYPSIQGTCSSLCGGYNAKSSNLQFLDVSDRVLFRWEHEGVIVDTDGSLCGKDTGRNVLPKNDGLPNSCTSDVVDTTNSIVDAVACPLGIKFLRVGMNKIEPSSLGGKALNVTNDDGSVIVPYKDKDLTHKNGWSFTIMMGDTVCLEFVNAEGFVNITYDVQIDTMESGDCVIFKHKVTEKPTKVSVDGGGTYRNISDNPFTCATSGLLFGDWYHSSSESAVYVAFVGEANRRKKRSAAPEPSANTISGSMLVVKCPFPDCKPPLPLGAKDPEEERPSPFLWWNDESTWSEVNKTKVATGSGSKMPQAGDNVTIPLGQWVVIKNVNPPILYMLTIFGGLEIDNNTSEFEYTFQASYIFIIGGQFNIGWKNYPFPGLAIVRLMGSQSSHEYLHPNLNTFNIGKKAIACFGSMGLYGSNASSSWTTLLETARRGDTSIKVNNAADIIDWKVGDKFFITSTSYAPIETEERTIQTINTATGQIGFAPALNYGHTAGSETVDGLTVTLAAAVGRYSRNVIVEGAVNAGEKFGGRILTSVAEYNGSALYGNAEFINVWFRNMGQDGYTSEYDSRSAASYVSTEVKSERRSGVYNCSFTDLQNSAITVSGTADLEVHHNVVYKPNGNGIVTNSERSFLIGNLCANLQWTGTYNGRSEKFNFRYEGCFEAMKSVNVTLKYNYAANSQRAGFNVPGEKCSIPVEDSRYFHNIGFGNMHGLFIKPGDDLKPSGITDCTRISNFIMAKSLDCGIYYNNEFSVQFTDNILSDNTYAIFPMVYGPPSLGFTCSDKTVQIWDSTFFGTFPSSDCTDETTPTGKYLDLSDKHRPSLLGKENAHLALSPGQFISGDNGFPEMGLFGITSYNAICGLTNLTGSSFYYFSKNKVRGCSKTYVIGTNPLNQDLQHFFLTSNNMVDEDTVDSEMLAYIGRPSLREVNSADCVDMPCDAMKKFFIEDQDGSLFGIPGTVVPQAEFQWDGLKAYGTGDYRIPTAMLTNPLSGTKLNVEDIFPNGKGIIRNEDCDSVTQSDSSGYHYCKNAFYNLLVLQSLDGDSETRRLSPVGLGTGGFIDLINGPQDHGWCSGYTCRKRVSLFHGMVKAGENVSIFLSSTQPDKIQFFMLNANDSDCIVVDMFLVNPFRYDAFTTTASGKVNVPPKNLDHTSTTYKLLHETGVSYVPTCDDPHGSNYINIDKKLIYFVLKGSKDVMLKKINVVICNFKVLNLDDVFGEKIIDNLALLLNVPGDMVRIVNIKPFGTSSNRRRREATEGAELTVEVGPGPTDDFDADNTDVSEYGAIVMDSCLVNDIAEDLNMDGIECGDIIVDDDTYTPTPPSSLTFHQPLTPRHENVPFMTQPKLRAQDALGNIVEHLGIKEYPWEITASLSCTSCHANAALIGTTSLVAENGWFNFTDLGISHKGDGYVIKFTISAPASAVALNLSLESDPISVDGVPMTASVHSMTIGDIVQDDTFSITFDLRDSYTDEQIPDLTWRDHTEFKIDCDLVVPSATGNLTGTLEKTFDLSTGLATFDDLSYSGFGLFYFGCHIESTPVDFDFYSVHEVFVIASHQVNILPEVRKTVIVRYKLDFDETLPTDIAKAQFHQATLEYFISNFGFVVIRESFITRGSILITFTLDGSNSNVTSALNTICEDLSKKLTIDVGASTVTLDSYMTVDGEDYYAQCGKQDEDEDGLHPAYIALIVILCVIFLTVVVFIIVWRCKILPKQKTHSTRRFQVQNYPDVTVNEPGNTNSNIGNGGFYYIDNGRTVFLGGQNQKVRDIFYKQRTSTGISTESIAPVATLYDDTPGYLGVRRSPLPKDPEIGKRALSNLTPTGV